MLDSASSMPWQRGMAVKSNFGALPRSIVSSGLDILVELSSRSPSWKCAWGQVPLFFLIAPLWRLLEVLDFSFSLVLLDFSFSLESTIVEVVERLVVVEEGILGDVILQSCSEVVLHPNGVIHIASSQAWLRRQEELVEGLGSFCGVP